MIQQLADGVAPGAVSGTSGRADPQGRPGSDFEGHLRVLVVDGEASTRTLLRGVLDGCSQFDVAGESGNAAAIELAAVLQPDVVLIGLSMPVSKRLSSVLGRPMTLGPAPPATHPPTAAPQASLQAQPRAIICDDDAVTRRLVAQLLATCDVPVIAETDGVANLLSIVGMAKPELVVLDLWLAGESGTSALPEIRRISARTAVVVYSAQDAWKGGALPEGAAAFVTKPDFDELRATIHRLTAMTTR